MSLILECFMNRPLFALDADGVLVDYREAFARAWNHHFQESLTCQDPLAFRATNYWGVSLPEPEHSFWDTFDALELWANMKPMPRAIDACHRLVDLGYELVCVSSMPSHQAQARQKNLRELGFPIERLIACGHPHAGRRGIQPKHINPKKEAIEQLKPMWFVSVFEPFKAHPLPCMKHAGFAAPYTWVGF